MATLYWGPTGANATGTWDASTVTNWYTDLARTVQSGAAPTAVDDVVFDASSNVALLAFTVTIGVGAVCKTFSTGGAGGALDGVMTLAGSASWSVYGSLTFPAANLTRTYTGVVTFASTAIGNTITTNGVTLTTGNVFFNGVGGEWTLGGALTIGSALLIQNGSFITANNNVSCSSFSSSYSSIRSINLGSSTITVTGATVVDFTIPTNLTFNAGTSTITAASGNIFSGGGKTFYNVTIGSLAFQVQVAGANTFNNLSIATASTTISKWVSFGASQTINGTLTLGATNTYNTRLFICANNNAGTSNTLIVGSQNTFTCNAVAILADVDFRDTKFAGNCIGGGALTGTRLGNCGGNDVATITFAAPKTVYWNLAGVQNWSANGWAATNNGVPATTNFPLAQDTATFTELGAAGTVTFNNYYNVGNIQMADGISMRTTAFTFATSTITPFIYGNVTLFSNLTFTGTGALSFLGQGVTQQFTSAGKTLTQPVTIDNINGKLQLQDNLTLGSTLTTTLTSGTLDLSSGNRTLSTGLFNATNVNTRSILFGTGNITTTGVGAVWNTSSTTGFSYTGTPTVNISNNSATATTVSTGAMTQAQALNFNYTTGTYTLTDTSAVYKSVNFTGFSGTIPNSVRTIYGGATFVAGMTLTAGANATTFAATSGTHNITTAGKTLDFPITFFGLGGTFAFQDALTQGATRAFTINAGTVQLKAATTNTVGSFVATNSTMKYLQSTTPGTQATISDASGTNTVSYLTIRDSIAIGGATWFSPISQFNVDAGNNDGWDFFIQLGEYMYTRRKNKRLLINY
jgi:hypothetical protein